MLNDIGQNMKKHVSSNYNSYSICIHKSKYQNNFYAVFKPDFKVYGSVRQKEKAFSYTRKFERVFLRNVEHSKVFRGMKHGCLLGHPYKVCMARA